MEGSTKDPLLNFQMKIEVLYEKHLLLNAPLPQLVSLLSLFRKGLAMSSVKKM